MTRRIPGALVITFSLVLLSSAVYAVSFGTSPGVLDYNDVLRDGYAERVVTISTNSETSITASWEFLGNYSDWISFEPENETFTLSKSRPYKLKVKINPPSDVQNQVYTTYVRIATLDLGRPNTAVGAALRSAVILRINIGITGTEILKCDIGGISIPPAEEGYPLSFQALIQNRGNVITRPDFSVDIWDQLQENLLSTFEFEGPDVLPTTQETFNKELPADLEPGQYWAFVSVDPCGGNTLITFDVYEAGSIIDQGTLLSLSSKVWATVNETVPIAAEFRNDGSRFVNAIFKGTVKLDGAIVEVIQSDELRVEPKETTELTTFFTPPEPGQYEVSGRVLYNKKLTFERGTIINVNPPGFVSQGFRFNLLPLFIYILILIIIIFLIARIRKLRREYT